MAIKKFISWGRFRRDNTRLGCLLLFLLGVICVLCVCMNITYQGPEGSFLDYGSTWRSLLGLSDHGNFTSKQPNGKDERVCKVPKLSLKTNALKLGYRKLPKLSCKGNQLFYLQDSVLRINRTELGEKNITRCVYRAIERLNDRRHKFSEPLVRKDNFEIRVKNDFYLVECCTEKNKTSQRNDRNVKNAGLHELNGTNPDEIDLSQNKPLKTKLETCSPQTGQFFAHIHRKHDVLERILSIKPFVNSTQLNVLMFALDSMSHMAYQRYLPKTYAYLKDTLKAVILDAYNIVGDATTAAIIPILTGQTEEELPDARVNKKGSHHVDIYPLIWNKFEQSGYVTLYTEDAPAMNTFNLRLNGFEEEPVDHYMRHFWLAIQNSKLRKRSAKFCLGSKPKHQYALDYVKDLFIKYQSVAKFAFCFLAELSHGDNNPAQHIDADLKEFLEYMKLNGHLDNTLLFVMADHGARFSVARKTLQGKLEERLPMMSLTFPDKFKKQYPQLMENLQMNKERLATPFDIHETLKTVLNIYNAEKPVTYKDRGISLLNRIPVNRTCDSAGIALHWCTCMQQKKLDIEDKKVKDVAGYIVSHINKKIDIIQHMCKKLYLKRILNAVQVIPNEKVLKYLRSTDKDQRIASFGKVQQDIIHYQITIETAPNDAVYEGTIQIIVASNTPSVIGDISRINRYGDQPHCIMETYPELRKYCLCKNPNDI